MKKRIAIALLLGVMICAGGLYMVSAKEMVEKHQEEKTDLFPTEEIKTDKNNFYVESNNELVKAIELYEDKKITYEEYEERLKKIQDQISKKGYKELEKAENKYKEGHEKNEK